ncbi:restriction endonuclease subunit S [Acinetobacter bereziniae]|uniref:restriction endonuclease subunit S n=1 Tax=Acinetobacter bereziniae TaxID=106648 RepID=UPI00124FD257|nr:restriction endonuclease subunit S [Acinetobacter bereziniae]
MTAPKLRFKEFDGDWIISKLGDEAKFIQGEQVPLDDQKKQEETGLIKFLRIENFTQKSNDFRYIHFTGSQDKVLNETDIAIVRYGATAGFICSGKHGVIANNLFKVKVNNNIIDQKFLEITLKAHSTFIYFQSEMAGGAMPALNFRIVGNLKFNFPSKEEQTKIASFLSAVNEKISQLTQKNELLSQYKQGMMQKLFSQQIRFKADDGSEFGEWESEKISKVFTNKSKSFNPLLNESLPCIELEHLSQNTGQILGTVNSTEQQSTKNLFESNSVLYGKLRPYLRKFAKPKFKGVCSSEIWVLTGLKISNDYLFQFVQSEEFTELTNIQSGSKMPRADWNVIADAEIEYPCLEEQIKIANFLSAIDQKIEVVAQQIEQAKTWKKGLLQQMFV